MDEALRAERLRAMGVRAWRLRARPQAVAPEADCGQASAADPVPANVVTAAGSHADSPAVIDERARGADSQSVAEGTPALDNASASNADVDDFGPTYDADEQFVIGDGEEPSLADVLPTQLQEPASIAVQLAPSMQVLGEQVSACKLCDLHRSRKQTVFGVGNESARLLVVGEAPGAEEDASGEPFVGRAGQLLNAMLSAIGLAREEVYIANILKCRPPRNRDPLADEVESCEPYLQQQIAFIEPELILAVGRVAAQHLLGVSTSIAKLRGQSHRYGTRGTPVIVTYHPAYLLRSPLEKRRAWEDLKQAAARLGPRS